MNKTYFLVLILLSVSFTGCLNGESEGNDETYYSPENSTIIVSSTSSYHDYTFIKNGNTVLLQNSKNPDFKYGGYSEMCGPTDTFEVGFYTIEGVPILAGFVSYIADSYDVCEKNDDTYDRFNNATFLLKEEPHRFSIDGIDGFHYTF